ncbi:MAG: two pore domain potassium channel family protein [Candidatus Scalindua sp. AMX11]|nr:MAG: two pore domain potassium channel family protein [Candidatus Scalindua sp.]NOG84280.1 two pore domain potassium channel family protein [Planctomycetota bacterium]RZV67149.1 MAG: two pore domain potassium channel family protein [Candidatus Scalindua sp. SCAELEC01]TDE63650.1 MAG: two pore domain potassium channel family protein [Candidatus Scalindua sp. AMX11]GJQ60779.1 MAG: hypothetical protein SCALA701_35800 [Candidatus Scalindua sp.]
MIRDFYITLKLLLFRDRFLFLLISITGFMVISPLFKGSIGIRILMDVFITAVFITGIYAVVKKTRVLILATSLAFPMFALIWASYFIETPFPLLVVRECFGILFFCFMIISILSFVFREKDVTNNIIYGVIVVYLFIGVTWALIYALIETINPGSFKIAEGHINIGRSLFFYYSFVTLTTLGFGDITPLTAPACSLSILEAIIGQLYLAILIARLVGIHIAQSMNGKSG